MQEESWRLELPLLGLSGVTELMFAEVTNHKPTLKCRSFTSTLKGQERNNECAVKEEDEEEEEVHIH